MIKALADWIEANSALVVGTDLFVGHLPQEAMGTASVILERVPGRVDTQTAVFEAPIQIWTQGASYFTARDAAVSLCELLVNRTGVSIDGYRIQTVTGNRPAYMGMDAKGLFGFSTNLLMKVNKTE